MDEKDFNLFLEFISDKSANEMYISGMAGTGKTTSMGNIINYCIGNKINTVTCAYTHKAVEQLQNKVKQTKDNLVVTLHSYLRKCPTINSSATKVSQVESNAQIGRPERFAICFIDEYSMIGDKDYEDIKDLIKRGIKFVYLGDPNQLPPVKDEQVIYPQGKYQILLTKVYRQKEDSKLLDTLIELNSFIGGTKPTPLTSHESLIRNTDIVKEYKDFNKNKCLLAYTNLRVQELNASVQGYNEPKIGDKLYSPSLRKHFYLEAITDYTNYVHTRNLKSTLELGSKYRTLETITALEGIYFYTVTDIETEKTYIIPAVFGHSDYMEKDKEFAKNAVKTNRAIEKQTELSAKDWAWANRDTLLAKDRANAWKNYLSFKEHVFCLDFAHAMTVHKSQGSTFERVFIDTDDLAICAEYNYNMYLRLLYVAISRASDKVYTN